MPTEQPTTDDDDDETDYSSVLAAYHRSLVSGTSDEFDPSDAVGLGGAVDCLRMLERQRQLTDSTLGQSTTPMAGGTLVDKRKPIETEQQPGRIGRFEIIRRLGSGGSGVVMLARDPELDREIALKVPTPDSLLREEFVERFQREGALAARLKHPHIVSVLETGSIGPICYIATEFCSGPNLLQWFKGKRPVSPLAAARLLRVLADAVQHAHSRGILHRDIKPSNILLELDLHQKNGLLSEDQLANAARLADFGLAKNLADSVNVTSPAAIIGTPSFMSPEQAAADSAEIGTHSDIFSLGVILYELLTDVSPFKRESPLATLRAVREFEPKSIGSIRPEVPADLAAICRKCLEKQPGDRYATAAALEEDLANFLNNRPVVARPISKLRRSWRWMKRNPWLAGLASLVAMLTILIAVGSSIAAVSLARTKQQVEAEAKNKIAVSNFLSTEILDQASPFVNPNRQLTLFDALEQAARRLEGHFNGQPLVEAEIRLTIGRTYRQLARFDQAEFHLNRAHDLRAKALGDDDPETLRVAFERAWIDCDTDKEEAALAAWKDIARKQRLALGVEHPDTLRTNSYLAYCYALLRDFDAAGPLFEKTEAAYVRRLGENHPDTLDCLDNRARMLQFQEKYKEAEALHKRILAARLTALGELHPHYLDSLSALAYVMMMQGRPQEAVKLFGKAVELRRRTLGEHHPDTLDATGDAAKALYRISDFDAAEHMYADMLAAQREQFGSDDARTLSTMISLAALYKARAQYDAAGDLFAEVLESRRRVLGEHKFTASGLRRLASIRVYQERFEDAEKLHRELIALETRLHGSDSQPVFDAMQLLGHGFQQAGRLDESEKMCSELLERHTTLYGRDHSKTLKSIMRLAFTKWRLNKYPEAEALFREAWDRSPAVLGPSHGETLRAGTQLGKMLIRMGRPEEAEPLIRQTLEARVKARGPYHVDTGYSLDAMAYLREAQGNPAALADVQEQRFEYYLKVNGATHENVLAALRDWINAASKVPSRGNSESANSTRERLSDAVATIEEAYLIRLNQQPEDTAMALRRIAFELRQVKLLDDAERVLKNLVERQSEHFGRQDAETLRSLMELAFLYKIVPRSEEAVKLFREIWSEAGSVWGPDARDTLAAGNQLAVVLRQQGKLEEAATLAGTVLERCVPAFGEHDSQTADCVLDLVLVLERLDKPQELTSAYERLGDVFGGLQFSGGQKFDDGLRELKRIAQVHEDQSRLAQTIQARKAICAITAGVFSENHKRTADALGVLAGTQARAGEWQQSHDTHVRELAIRRQPGIQPHPPLFAEYLMANDLSHLDRDVEAIELLRANVDRWESLSPDSPKKFSAYELLGELLTGEDSFDEAEAVLLSAYEKLPKARNNSVHHRNLAKRLVALYEASDQPEQAARWQGILDSLP